MTNKIVKNLWRHVGAGLLLTILMPALPGAYGDAPPSGTLVTIHGVLTVHIVENLVEDEPLTARMDYSLHDSDADVTYQLQFDGDPPDDLGTGQGATVEGYIDGDILRVEKLTPDGQLPVPTIGERNAVVIIVDMINALVSTEYPDIKATVASVMYTGNPSVNSLYSDSSRNQIWFKPDTNGDGQPDIFGPFSIAYDPALDCKYMDWARAAEAAATNAGVNLGLYQHRVFVLPRYNKLPKCGFSGLSDVSCDPICRSWIAEAGSPLVYAHELGHTLNMAHAGVDPENDGTINNVYADYSDPQSSTRKWRRFNAPHIDQLGWYAPYPGSIVNVTTNGTYSIAPIGTAPAAGAPLILKLRKPDNNQYYYLSYRKEMGLDCFDATTCIDSTYTRGVNIHRYRGSGYGHTAFIQSLNDNETFTDSVNAITVTQISHSGNLATVSITLCDAQEPLVSLTPASRATPPGGTASYDVTITNRDASSACRTNFTLSYSGAGGGVLSPTLLNLGGGQSGVATLQVNTAGLADGVYNTPTVQAADNDGLPPVHPTAGSASVTLIVDGAPPTAPAGLQGSSNAQGTAITLNWMAATDALSGVQSYQVYRDGVPLSGEINALSYVDATTVNGATYTYTVAAKDGAGNSSSAAAVTIASGCAAHTPTVSLSPSSRAVKPGVTAAYTATVTNTDAVANCPPTTFTLGYSGTSGGSLSPSSLTLGPGQSDVATLTISKNQNNSYTLSVQAADNDGVAPAHADGVSNNVTLHVDGAPPTIPTGLQGAAAPQGKVNLSWNSATDALSGLAYYQVYRNGVAIDQTVNLSYQDAGAPLNATHQYAVTAVDHAGNESPMSALISVYNGCQAANPIVTLTPSSQIVKPNVAVSYAATVANQDNSGCAATTFTLSSTGTPAGSVSPTTLSLSGGQSGSATLTVSSSSNNNFTPAVQAADNDGLAPTHAAVTASASLTVDGVAPTAPSNVQATTDQNQVMLTWTAATDSGSGVATYTVYRNGVALGQTATPAYADSNVTAGQGYVYTIKATDRAGNESAASTAVEVIVGCNVANPTVTLTPASQPARPGATPSYTVAVVNQDSGVCPATTFTLSYTGAPTLANPLTPATLTLAAGQSGEATLTLNTTGLSSNSYPLQVKATDSDGALPGHALITGNGTLVVDSVAPSIPTGLQATTSAQGSNGVVTLSWNPSTDSGGSGLQGYLVYRNGVLLNQDAITGASYVDDTAQLGTNYNYKVSAKDQAGNMSALSSGVDVLVGCTPAAPTVELTPPSQAVKPGVNPVYSVKISNNDSGLCPATTFTLSYTTSSPSGSLTPTTVAVPAGQSITGSLQVMTSGLNSKSYTLTVQAADNDGALPPHATVTGNAVMIVDNTAPTVPTGLQSSTNGQNQVVLTWTAATDALAGVQSYVVKRGGVQITETTDLSYTDSGAQLGVSYSYTVAAKDKAGNVSTDSTAVSVLAGCAAANPTVTLTPVSQAAKLSAIATYSVSVTNNDSGICPTTVFTLSYTVAPTGPTVTLSPTSFTLGAGQTGAATLTAKYTRAGTFTLNVQAADNDGKLPAHTTVTGSATLVTDGTAPSAPTNLQASSTAQGQVTLTWSAAADNSGGSGVGGYIVKRGGVQIGEVAATTYVDTVTPGVAVSYTVAAKDRAGNISTDSTAVSVLPGCAAVNPVVTVTPNRQAAKLSVAVTYTVTVLNQDSGACPTTTFTLSGVSSPTGPTLTLTPTTLTLGAGQSGAATLKATYNRAGTFTLNVQAADNDNKLPTHAAITGGATFVTDGTAPSAPTNLQAVSTEQGQVTLTWNAAADNAGGSGVTGYIVKRGGAILGEATATSYVDTVTPGTAVSYTVAAKDLAGNVSADSTSVSVLPGCAAADPSVTLSPVSQAVKTGAVTYTVTVLNQDSGTCPQTTFTLSATSAPTGPSLTLSSTSLRLSVGQSGTATVQANTSTSGNYTIQVKATDGDGALPAHNAVTGSAGYILDNVAPTTPANVQGSSNAQGQITLSWSAATDAGSGMAGYIIKRGGVEIGQTDAATLTYVDSNTTLGATYSYTVAARDALGNVSANSAAAAVVSGCATATPTVALAPASQITKLNTAVNYTVTVANQDGPNCPATTFTLSGASTPAGPTFTFTPTTLQLTSGQSGTATVQVKSASSAAYAIQINVADNDGAAPSHVAASAGANFTADGVAPTTPSGLAAVVSPGKVALSWTASSDALSGMQSYLVYRGGAVIAETTTPNYDDTAVTKGVKYTYTVAAKDKAGNVSSQSGSKSVTAQ